MLTILDRVDSRPIARLGRAILLAGVVLPLGLIGGLKFTQFEVEALKPIITSTPWLAWMYPVLGEAGTSRALGITEITTALLIIASTRFPRAGVAGGALAGLIFLVTSSLLFSMPVWEPALGGFPALSGMGQFLIKDIALLGAALLILSDSLARSVTKAG